MGKHRCVHETIRACIYPFSQYFRHSGQKQALDNLSFKMMTTEKNMNRDAENVEEGMRQRTMASDNRQPSALSVTSKMYDVDGDGKLDEAEQAMRDKDIKNRGFLSNEEVYKVMLDQMKLQREVFGLKRIAMVLVSTIFLLSLATLGTSFAAAILAKDTDVEDGNLVAKDGGGVLATSNFAATYALADGAEARRLQNTYGGGTNGALWISRPDAEAVWAQCLPGGSVNLARSCNGGNDIHYIPFCTIDHVKGALAGPMYTSTKGTDEHRIDCSESTTAPCTVVFAAGTPGGCDTNSAAENLNAPVDLTAVGDYVILAKTGISTTALTTIDGDIAVSPIAATSITGFALILDLGGQFSTSSLVSGEVHAASYGGAIAATLTPAVVAMGTAYTEAAGRPRAVGARLNLEAGILNKKVLTPGVYTFDTSVSLTGDIHFQGSETDVFIIQIAGNLVQAAGYQVFLDTTSVGTPLAKNIFWQVSGFATMMAGSHMEGILLVKTAVVFVTGSSINGRILTQTACTLDAATVVVTL
jgi:hypothetical protein